jgi:hypothetical protein
MMAQVRGFFWNCRGFRKKGVASYIRELLRVQRLDFACFQETILQDLPDASIRLVDPNKVFLWDWVPSKGRAGGLISGINMDRFDVGSRTQGDFILQHNLWDKMLEVKWNLLNVYGAPHEEQKEEFLRELAMFCSKCDVPYIVGGGFNITRFSSEKNKKFIFGRFSGMFNSVIQTYDLSEIAMSGGGYTWSNNHKDPTLERLDRVLMSKDWEALFPKVCVHKLPRYFSDHNPLIMATLCHQDPKVNEFKFELSWLRHPDFYQKVKDIWEVPTRDNRVLDRVLFKIKKVKKILIGWGYNLSGMRKKRTREIQEELAVLELLEEQDSLAEDQVKRKIELKVKVFSAYGGRGTILVQEMS